MEQTTGLVTTSAGCMCLCLQYGQIAQEVEQIEGVITHGLLLDAADVVIIADPKKGVREVQPQAAALLWGPEQ